MNKFTYQNLAKVILCCGSLFASDGPSKAQTFDLEGPNFIGRSSLKRPQHDLEDKRPQGQRIKRETTDPKESAIQVRKVLKNSSISSLFEKEDSAGSRDLRSLFYNNEYGRD